MSRPLRTRSARRTYLRHSAAAIGGAGLSGLVLGWVVGGRQP